MSVDKKLQDNLFTFIGRNGKKALLLFVLFWAIFYFLIDTFDNYQRIPPVTIAAVLSTLFYCAAFYLLFYLYAQLKMSLAGAQEINLSHKMSFGFKIALILIMLPNFMRTIATITEGDMSLLAIIIILFLIPTWILFSILIKKMLSGFYVLAVIFLGLAIMTAAAFLQAPLLESITKSRAFLSEFLDFISTIFFPAFLINLFFIELPTMLKKDTPI
jgi:uncharacterized membrane protein YhaH (DUF805 family)